MAKTGNQYPTRSIILSYSRTAGTEARRLYEESGRKLMPWQSEILSSIMSYRQEDNLWSHVKFGYSVPRRNGKSEILLAREFWGLCDGEKICHTAHRVSTAHDAWVKLARILADCGYVELGRVKRAEPPEKSFKPTKQYGLESIKLTNGGEITFRTRTANGGLGEGFDLLIIDEAQEYTDAQESALKYTVTDSANPQTILCGTPPTAVSVGTVFPKMRKDALEGKTIDTGWAEWSVDRIVHDFYDTDVWYDTNPSLGYHLTERNIRAEIGGDFHDFSVQRLGYWTETEIRSAITKAEWDAAEVKDKPKLIGGVFVGVKFSRDGERAALSIGAKCADGRIFIECLGCEEMRKGVGWMVDIMSKLDLVSVVADGANGQEILRQSMRLAKLPVLKLPTVKEVVASYAEFEQSLYMGKVCHAGQKGLAEIATACKKRQIGSAGGWGYAALKEDGEISILDSAVLAFWLCKQGEQRKKQKISY